MKTVKRRHKTIIILLAIPLLLFIAFLLTLYIIQGRLLFLANSDPDAAYYIMNNPTGCEKIQITGDNGTEYSGYLHRCGADDARLLIYFGGNAGNSASAMMYWSQDDNWSHLYGYDVLMIDYPGYGKSKGSPTEKSFYEMADSVMEYAGSLSEYRREDTVIMGFSLGTGVANYVAANYDISKLILIAPFDRILTVYNRYINVFHGPFKVIAKYSFNSSECAEKIDVPVLIIASSDDETIPVSSTRELNKHYKNSELVTLEKYHHNEILSQKESWEMIESFLR